MANKSRRYWTARGVRSGLRQQQDQGRSSHRIDEIIGDATEEMERRINEFWQRYGDADGVSPEAARATLTDRRAYHLTLDEYNRLAERYPQDKTAARLLDKFYYTSQISRLEHLQLQLNLLQTKMIGRVENETRATITRDYEDAYYRQIYDTHHFNGVASPFERINPNAVQAVVNAPVAGKNFSERLWGNRREELAHNVNQILGPGIASGTSRRDMANQLSKAMGITRDAARLIIHNEAARVQGRASLDSLLANGTPQYRFIAVLDASTSKPCRYYDNQVFDISEAVLGENFPPIHVRCRSKAVPEWPDEPGEDSSGDTRFVRDKDGNPYTIPADMSYQDWYNKYVKDYPDELLAYTRRKNQSADLSQWHRYQDVLGDYAPKNLAEWQKMKYTDGDKWSDLQNMYREVNWQRKALENGRLVGKDHAPPTQGEPYSVYDNNGIDGKVKTRRYYGKTGKVRLDIDMDDHGNPKRHPIVPHAHSGNEDTKYTMERGKERKLSKGEQLANKDILREVDWRGYDQTEKLE